MVLTSPDMPSILVETGFISNPAEARKLNQAGYQNQLARSALRDGIRDYMERSAPPGTLVALQRARGKKCATPSSAATRCPASQTATARAPDE